MHVLPAILSPANKEEALKKTKGKDGINPKFLKSHCIYNKIKMFFDPTCKRLNSISSLITFGTIK